MSYTCPRCGATSQHPGDEQAEYCGACHRFADDTGIWQVYQHLQGISPTADETPERPAPSGPDQRP